MRKKYFALIMTCILSSSILMSGCGNNTGAVAEAEDDDDASDEDEDEDDEDDEDKDDEEESEPEEEQPKEPVTVAVIDDDSLYSQIEIFMKNRDDIFFPESEDYAHTTCMLTDLDHNGRCELILTGGRWYGDEHESRVFEINETKDGIYQPDYVSVGIDSKLELTPDFGQFDCASGYYDAETGRYHYLIWSSLSDDFSGVYGSRYMDVSLSEGTIETDVYGKYKYKYVDSDCVYTFTVPNGEVEERDDFDEYINSYAQDRGAEDVVFGIYEGDYYYPLSDGDIETMDSDKLTEVLADSYRVFTGEIDTYEYLAMHSTHSNPYDDPDKLLKDCVGSWGLYVTDTEGDVTFYEPDSEYYMLIDIYEDGSVELQRFLNTGYEQQINVTLEEDEYALLKAEYAPDAKPGTAYSILELDIVEVNRDGMLVISTSSWYGTEYNGGSTWYFKRL